MSLCVNDSMSHNDLVLSRSALRGGKEAVDDTFSLTLLEDFTFPYFSFPSLIFLTSV